MKAALVLLGALLLYMGTYVFSIGPPLRSAHAPANPVGQAITDAVVTAKIKAALRETPGVDSADITVVTNRGIVELSGSVPSSSQIGRVERVARGIPGVLKVENRIAFEFEAPP